MKFKKKKDRIQPGRLSAEGYATVAMLAELRVTLQVTIEEGVEPVQASVEKHSVEKSKVEAKKVKVAGDKKDKPKGEESPVWKA